MDWLQYNARLSMREFEKIPKEYWPIVWEYGYVVYTKGEPVDKVRDRMEKQRQSSAPYNQENKDED